MTMKTDNQSIPAYVDTATPPRRWFLYHFGILLASLGMLIIASLIIEHELARLANPGVAFIDTPLVFDMVIAATVALLAFANLAVLIFVFMRHLWLRRWMLATTIIGWMLLATLVLVLRDLFLPVLLPGYR